MTHYMWHMPYDSWHMTHDASNMTHDTFESETDLERVQKSAFWIIVGNQYISYNNGQHVLKMETLKERREILFRLFAIKSLQIKQMKTILKDKINTRIMETRKN